MGLDSQILVITCVDPNPTAIEHSLPALKFCASLREQIHKKLKKYAPVQKKKKPKKFTEEMQNLLLSQIKASERFMVEVKAKLVEVEYQM